MKKKQGLFGRIKELLAAPPVARAASLMAVSGRYIGMPFEFLLQTADGDVVAHAPIMPIRRTPEGVWLFEDFEVKDVVGPVIEKISVVRCDGRVLHPNGPCAGLPCTPNGGNIKVQWPKYDPYADAYIA